MRLLAQARAEAAAGRQYEPTGLVRRSLRKLGGPVRRVSELDADDLRANAERVKRAHAESLAAVRAFVEAPTPEPDPPRVFACEHRDDDTTCGQPAPHLSADRRRPPCDGHRDDETEGSAA
jgi:hypothetical protein